MLMWLENSISQKGNYLVGYTSSTLYNRQQLNGYFLIFDKASLTSDSF